MTVSDNSQPVTDEAGKAGFRLSGIETVEKQHEITLRGETLRYLSRAGVLPLTDSHGKTEAEIFYTAYEVLERNVFSRPLTFIFNGGPGSSSIWLHMGACGPRRVVMHPEGWMPPPPFHLEDNQGTWLDRSDLVFIDPVETGLSRGATEDAIDKFWGYRGDIDSVWEFIRLYLTRYGRWSSPIFLAGESYGTTRAAGLAVKHAFSGIVLISTAINLRPIMFEQGDDLPFHLFVPTYAAAAWYHKKLSAEYLERQLPDLLTEVALWSEEIYAPALLKGDRLSEERFVSVAETLAAYTGLDPSYVAGANLRINGSRFRKELLRDEKRSVGRLDARFKGVEGDCSDDIPEYDPSFAAIQYAYSSVFLDYLASELGVSTDMEYRTMHHFKERSWKWEEGKLPYTGECLRKAMGVNPFMKVFVAQGYYDLATPHLATEYMVSHMNMDASVRKNLRTGYYDAGHMFYLDAASLEGFRKDIEDFFNDSLSTMESSPSED